MDDELVAKIVIDAAVTVHRLLGGPGLLESVYEEALAYELRLRGLRVERQVVVPIVCRDHTLQATLRLDMLVEGCLIAENKSTEKYNTIIQAQTLTFLRVTNRRLGLVINFGEKLVSKGIHRVLNQHFKPL